MAGKPTHFERLNPAEAYAYVHAVLSSGIDRAVKVNGNNPFGKAGYIPALKQALTQLESEIPDDLQAQYASLQGEARNVVDSLSPNAFSDIIRNIVVKTADPKIATHDISAILEKLSADSRVESLLHPVVKTATTRLIDPKMFGLSEDGKPLSPPEVPASELAALCAPAIEENALAAARAAEHALTNKARTEAVMQATAAKLESFTQGLAKHTKPALQEAMQALAELANIHIAKGLSEAASGLKNTSKNGTVVTGEADEKMIRNILKEADERKLRLREQKVLTQLRHSPQEVKNAFTFLSGHFPVPHVAEALLSKEGETYKMLNQISKASGYAALGSLFLIPTLLDIANRPNLMHQQNKNPLNIDPLTQTPVKTPMHIGRIFMNTTAALCAIGGAVMAVEYFGGGRGPINKAATSNLLKKLEEIKKNTAATIIM